MNYLDLWVADLLRRRSVLLLRRITVVGHREKHLGPRSEFAKVEITVEPADELHVVDDVPCRQELEELGIAWPHCVVFGVLDILMLAEFGPLHKTRITLNDAAYHEIDSSESAFREAGREAGRNIIETAKRDRIISYD